MATIRDQRSQRHLMVDDRRARMRGAALLRRLGGLNPRRDGIAECARLRLQHLRTPNSVPAGPSLRALQTRITTDRCCAGALQPAPQHCGTHVPDSPHTIHPHTRTNANFALVRRGSSLRPSAWRGGYRRPPPRTWPPARTQTIVNPSAARSLRHHSADTSQAVSSLFCLRWPTRPARLANWVAELATLAIFAQKRWPTLPTVQSARQRNYPTGRTADGR